MTPGAEPKPGPPTTAMPVCRHVSTLISRSMDERLSLRHRCMVALHVLYCRPCRRFRAQLRLMRRAARRLTEGQPRGANDRLTDEARARIRAAVASRIGRT